MSEQIRQAVVSLIGQEPQESFQEVCFARTDQLARSIRTRAKSQPSHRGFEKRILADVVDQLAGSRPPLLWRLARFKICRVEEDALPLEAIGRPCDLQKDSLRP